MESKSLREDEFIPLISHELRTPLTSIKGYVDLLSKNFFGNLNEKQQSALRIVQKEVNRLNFIIENLLGSSTIEDPNLKLKIEASNIIEVINKGIQKFKNLNTEPVEFEIENLEDYYPLVYIDKEKIAMVFLYLFDNAVKFNLSQHKKIMIKIKNVSDDDVLKIIVRDNGTGIPLMYYKSVMERFKQIENFMNRRHEGLGLGLYLAKKIIERNGGKFGLKSELNQYTEIIFTLPTVDVAD